MKGLVRKEDVVYALKEYLKSLIDKGVRDCDITEFCVDLKQIVQGVPEREEWISVDNELPSDDRLVLMSFSNFTLPVVGRYEQQEDGSGNWYIGDCDEEDTCLANDLFVNAWMELPERYEG